MSNMGDNGRTAEDAETVTHLEQTFRQSPPDHGPQKGAKDKEGDLGPGDVRVIQESLFGEPQTAVATVSPRAQHDAGASGDELQVSRHGLHLPRPRAPGVSLHTAAPQGGQKKSTEKLEKPGGITRAVRLTGRQALQLKQNG